MRQTKLTQAGAPGCVVGLISHTSKQQMEFAEIFNLSSDSSYINFARFNGCGASLVSSWYSALECYSLFSGVKLSIRSSFVFHEWCVLHIMKLHLGYFTITC